jgi:sugar phosphate isomerase/epimerase
MEFEYRAQDPLPLFDPYRSMPEPLMDRFVRIVRELGQEAENCRTSILLEPCNRYETRYLTRLQDCRAVLEKAGVGGTGVLADFFHMAIEEGDLPDSIHRCGSFIKHVHLGDSNRLLPGYGHTNWSAGLGALKEIGFDGYMNLECGIPGDPEVELPKVVRYLRSFGV